MKFKKLIVILILAILLATQIEWSGFRSMKFATGSQSMAESQVNGTFHYDQLTEEAKKIYQAMYNMYTEGIFKKGNQSYDLVERGIFTEDEVREYENGNATLTTAMNAARYAFYADYPGVFYVNFQKLSIRITKDADNHYHANLGSGRFANYYIEGFENETQVQEAIDAFNTTVNEIAEKAKNVEVTENQNQVVEQIKLVHNEIINNTGYRLESDCVPGNEGFISTPYGALVKKEAVCEGYARSLKTILDKVGINSILVQGTHQSEGAAAVPHMWNYVEIEKETVARSTEKVWYAIDATLDDPFLRDTTMDSTDPDFVPGSDIQEGFENTRYCMVGVETMQIEHVAMETVEAAGNYTFKYPELSLEDYGVDFITNVNGLLVKFKQEGTETEEYKSGDFYISYNNKGYAEAVKEGKYILIKYHEYKPGDDVWIEGKWGYMNPELYVPGAFKDYEDHLYISVPNSEYMEFAVTTLEPSEGLAGYTYQGDESDFVAESGKLYNPNGTYKAPPYIKYQTPVATASLTVGPTYHVDVTYTDDLVLADGATEAGYRMESTGATGVAESKIENFTFDGKNRITFDLTFSKMFADDDAMYRIYITGLVGKNSNKEPNYISYGAYNLIACSYSMNAAKSWNVFARPTLLENADLSMNGWVTSDGEAVSEKLKSRIALVATRTTQAEKETMDNLMEDELGDKELITSQTYNISLNVCKKYVVKTGHKLRLSLGFPAGYGPDDAGVTFKAYHFKRDAQDNVIGVEEIPCVITQYGLVVTCDAFSPFAIAVTENDGTEEQEKSVIVSASEGGQVEGANRDEGNIVTLAEGESATLNIVPEADYEIESVTVCGDSIEVTNKDTMSITLNYDDIKDGNRIVDVKFVAKEVVQKEEEKGETVVTPKATPATITMPETKTVGINKTLKIEPTVTETPGVQTYQWYKDDKKLEGKTNKVLEIQNIAEENAGTYVLKVTTTVDTVSEEVESDPCVVSIASFTTSIEKANNDTIYAGDEFEVNVGIDNFKNIDKGIITFSGQLEYDKNVLDKIEIKENQEGWNPNTVNEDNLKFVTDRDTYATEGGNVFTIKFKAKDTITTETAAKIALKNIVASNGDIDITSPDAEINVTVLKKLEDITSDKYEIADTMISRILPGTTVDTFKGNIVTNLTIKIIDKDGNELQGTDIIPTDSKLQLGNNLEFTLVVTGDIHANGEITPTDLAQLKLHFIGKELLTGAKLKAGDVNGDGDITPTDLAQLKLVLIGSMTIK